MRRAAAFVVLGWCGPAFAHGALDIGAFYAGAADWLLHWQQALFILAAGIWCAQQAPSGQLWLGLALVGGFATGAVSLWLGAFGLQPLLASAMGYTVIGLAVAGGAQTHWRWPLAMAAFAGAAAGAGLVAASVDTLQRPALFLLGALTGAALLLFYLGSALARLPAGWPRVGLRVVGSWIAAIGLIVCAFAVQRGA